MAPPRPPTAAAPQPVPPVHQVPPTLVAAVMSTLSTPPRFGPGRGAGEVIDQNIALCALRASDGAIVWHSSLDRDLHASVADLEQAEGVLYALQVSGGVTRVCAHGAVDGARRWCRLIPPSHLPLVIGEGTVYVEGASTVTALRASDGALRWQRPILRGDDPGGYHHYSEIAVVGGTVYIPSGWGQVGQVCALGAADGARRWCAALGDGRVFPPAGWPRTTRACT